ncbi:unnamed protein product, partial [Phaeothamnion confervicola]
GGAVLTGRYSDGVRLERRGPLAGGDVLNLAAFFDPDLRARVDTRAALGAAAGAAADGGGGAGVGSAAAACAAGGSGGAFTVEAWARVLGGEDTARVVVMTGRCCLLATRDNTWAFTVLSKQGIEVAAASGGGSNGGGGGSGGSGAVVGGGGVITDGAWTHVVGAFDGTCARLYVDARLCATVEVERAAA